MLERDIKRRIINSNRMFKNIIRTKSIKNKLKISTIQRKKDEYMDMCSLYSNTLSNPEKS